MDNVVFVWDTAQGGEPAGPPSVSVSLWPHLFGKQWLRPKIVNGFGAHMLPVEAWEANVAFVNIFHTTDSTGIQEIKKMNPDCYVIAMPDAPVDLVLEHPEWRNMHQQMALADAIGGRTDVDCDVYGTLLNKPTYYLPSPIGPTEYFAKFRQIPKEDYILSLDHSMSPTNTYCNVAALAAIQRETGIRVLYANEAPWTREYAALAGLKAEWLGKVPFDRFIEITAKARLCVDLYARHSYGRQQVLCAMVGTACVGSSWCENAPGFKNDPFDPQYAAETAIEYLTDKDEMAIAVIDSWAAVQEFTFDRSRQRLLHILESIEVKA